jgi:hypothetical protein
VKLAFVSAAVAGAVAIAPCVPANAAAFVARSQVLGDVPGRKER